MDPDAASRPRLKSSVEPIIDSDDGLFLLLEDQHVWFPDPVFAALAPLLDGAHDVEVIFERLSETHQAEDVLAALDRLQAEGYLASDAIQLPRGLAAFWENAGVPAGEASRRLQGTRVCVRALGRVDVGPLKELLSAQGIRAGDGGYPTVVVTEDYLHPQLEDWNAEALAEGIPWVLVKPTGRQRWLGPAFEAGRSACWACLAHRLRGHRRVEEHLGRRSGTQRTRAPAAEMRSSTMVALAEAATEVVRWIGSGGPSSLVDRVICTDVLTLERTRHPVIRRPQCPSCGRPEGRRHSGVVAVELRPRPKVATSDGGHRGRDPETVLKELERHLSPITGIVSCLEPGERSGPRPGDGPWVTPTFAADHNFSDMHDERFFLREGMRRRSGGKGKGPAQARASALAESLERYCGVYDGTESRVRTSLAELGSAAVHPNACMAYSDRQYALRGEHNERRHKAHWVPEPFQEDASIEWSPLWSLTRGEPRYLPTSYCYFGYRSPDPVFARADSNGCAAGSVLEEAVLQGLLELVERDAVALWWYNRLRRPGLHLESVPDPYVRDLTDRYQDMKRDLWVLDVTSDLGIPTFAALSRRVDKAEEDIIYGFGAHLQPAVALSRALTEVNQSLEAVPLADGPPAAQTYRGEEEAVRWWRSVRVAESPYLSADPGQCPRRLQDVPDRSSDDLCEDVRLCVDRLAGKGIEVLVLDQTRPDVGFPVVRVVAPGLRHFWARFGPGRLYDVPVQEGWRPDPLEEDQLNPFVIQF